MEATFENSITVLVRAYMNGTLEHGNCHACAVGNLIAAAGGVKFITSEISGEKRWEIGNAVWILGLGGYNREDIYSLAEKQMRSTGYTPDEINLIERAFEFRDDPPGTRRGLKCNDRDGFAGLMNVVDVLADIHHVDLETKERAKMMFVQ